MKPNFKLADNKTFLYTKGKQFSLDYDEYIGEYHYEGEDAYTGPIMTTESKKLSRWDPALAVMLYDNIAAADIKKIRKFVEPLDSFVEPEDNNYTDGYFIRYFVKRRNGDDPTIYEINFTDASRFGKDNGIDSGLYQLTEMQWAISKNEKTVDRIVRANVKNTLIANREMIGIADNIRNFFEFSFIVI